MRSPRSWGSPSGQSNRGCIAPSPSCGRWRGRRTSSRRGRRRGEVIPWNYPKCWIMSSACSTARSASRPSARSPPIPRSPRRSLIWPTRSANCWMMAERSNSRPSWPGACDQGRWIAMPPPRASPLPRERPRRQGPRPSRRFPDPWFAGTGITMISTHDREGETARKEKGKPPVGWRLLLGYAVLTLLLLWMWQEALGQMVLRTIPYSEFKAHLARGEVVECAVRQDEIEGRIVPKPGAVTAPGGPAQPRAPEPFFFRTIRVEDPTLVEELQKAGVKFVGVRPGLLSQLWWS